MIAQVALPLPHLEVFDYLLSEEIQPKAKAGCRVLVPFGPRKMVGLLVRLQEASTIPKEKLKPLLAVEPGSPLIHEKQL